MTGPRRVGGREARADKGRQYVRRSFTEGSCGICCYGEI